MLAQLAAASLILHLVATDAIPYYRNLSREDAARLAEWRFSKEPVWQLSGQHEGDMLILPTQRNSAINTTLRWPNRVIPVAFRYGDFTGLDQTFIWTSLSAAFDRHKTCLGIQPWRGEKDYVYVTASNTGCWSYVGRLGGRQVLNLQRNGCLDNVTIVHQFMHAAGFFHEHSALDRDSVLDIHWYNVIKGKEENFNKSDPSVATNFGTKYDYLSLMHFNRYAFSKNRQATITSRKSVSFGESKDLSELDVYKLNKMYGCGRTADVAPYQDEGYGLFTSSVFIASMTFITFLLFLVLVLVCIFLRRRSRQYDGYLIS